MATTDNDFLFEYVQGQHTVHDYFDRTFPVDVFDERCDGCPGLAVKCRQHLLSAFEALDALSRSDPFWAGSNMRTTTGKVGAFLDRLSPDQAWPSFALALLGSGNALFAFAAAAEALFVRGDLSDSELIRMFFNWFADSGRRTEDALVSLMRRVGASDRLRLQEALLVAEPQDLAEWARSVLQRLGNPGGRR